MALATHPRGNGAFRERLAGGGWDAEERRGAEGVEGGGAEGGAECFVGFMHFRRDRIVTQHLPERVDGASDGDGRACLRIGDALRCSHDAVLQPPRGRLVESCGRWSAFSFTRHDDFRVRFGALPR